MLNARELAKLRTLLAHGHKRLPVVFSALHEPRRCKIFRSFLTHDRLCVSDIAHTLRISMSLASQHLKILEATKLLVRKREGRTIYFRPNLKDPLVRAIIKAVQ